MKKFILVILLFFSYFYAVFSQQVTEQEAINAAINTMKYCGKSNFSKSNISSVYSKKNGDTTLMYEVIFQTGEMVMLSGNKACLPVLGYNIPDNNNSQKAIFPQSILNNYDNIPDGLKFMLEEYAEQIAYCFRNKVSEGYHNEWNELQTFQATRATRSVVVAPLLTTTWGQHISNDSLDCYAYNYYVTATSNNCTCGIQKKCLAGCVATAIAQIMNYWKSPVWLGNKTYEYDWCNMPNTLNTYSSNYIQERNAIARLMKDCGDAVNMNYCKKGSCLSESFDQDALNALKGFGYSDATLKKTSSSFMILTRWQKLLKSDLDKGWPIYYAGSGDGGGHAFVCDGYDSDNKFHFNWGWNGQCNDSWWIVTELYPNNNNYSYNQAAIFNIHPSGTQDYCNFNFPLVLHYHMYYTTYGNTTPAPYQNVPKTFTKLTSVPNSSQYPSSWRTIPSGATAEYVAHEEVLLEDGFEAMQGSNFQVYITPCYACENNKATPIVSNPLEKEKKNYTNPEIANSVIQPIEETSFATENPTLSIYPNPTNGTFHIKLENTEEFITQVYINNMLGTEMFRKNNLQNDESINIATLPAGLYVVNVITNSGKIYFGKLVKQ